ncbi:MAG: chemotaxis protein CheW [Thalassolituus sp.]|jgi:purine-binding chemotaxis protein CheW|nr:chemotaxis protein CheW [Pseudomonadota bacterium]TNC87109.1 MAG: chemotaxis protein CheW [Thalassolituus sp.]
MSAAEQINEFDDNEGEERQQYVTFKVGDELFAVEMNPVQEIIRVPDVVRVPLAPPSLCGLANLRGKVLPILSLRYLFGIPDAESDEATRAVVIDVGQPLGFVVDRVASVIDCDPSQLEDASTIRSSVDTTLLKGVIKNSSASSMVMVVDFQQLVDNEFAHLEHLTNDSSLLSDGLIDDSMNHDDAEEDDDEIQLVSFSVDHQEYAIHIDDVKEIVQMPESITAVPRSPHHILGLMNLRDQLLPMVDLRTMFALSSKDADEKSRVIVVASGGYFIGIVVDSVSEVLRINKDTVEALIPAMAKESELSDITDICRLNNGQRLVSILSIERFFDSGNLQDALNDISEEGMIEQENDDYVEEEQEDDNQVVVFKLDDEEFAVPITSIQEIVRIPDELIRVPKAPAFLEGVINLRGIVLPVVDLRTRLEIEAAERSERQRIVVFLIHGVRTGFIVDQVTEVLRLPDGCVEPSPKISEEHGELFSGMANLRDSKRMIQLINPDTLIDQESAEELETAAGGQ